MADLYLPERQTVPNTVEGVKAPYELADTSGQQNFGRAMERTGGYSFDRIIEMRAGNEFSDFLNSAQAEETNLATYVEKNPYASKQDLEAAKNKMLSNIENASSKMTTNRAREWAKRSVYSRKDALNAKATGVIEEVVTKQQIAKMRMDIDNAVATGDTETVKRIWTDNISAGLFGDVSTQVDETGKPREDSLLAASMRQDLTNTAINRQKAQKEMGEQAIGSVKPMIERTLKSGDTWKNEQRFSAEDKRSAYDMIDKQINDMVKQGIIDESRGFDAKTELNNTVDNYAKEFTKAEEEAKKSTAGQLFSDFSKQMLSGTISADAVADSDLSKPDKDFMSSVLAGSYKPAPEDSDFDGYQAAMGIINLRSENKIDKAEAHRQLMTMRYVNEKNGRINDNLYRQASAFIENPVQGYQMKTLKGVMGDVELFASGKAVPNQGIKGTWHGRWTGKAEEQLTARTNADLLYWYMNTATPENQPTTKDLWKKANEFYAANLQSIPKEGSRLYNIGDTVKRGGNTYEITGFDRDGMPIVDETPVEQR